MDRCEFDVRGLERRPLSALLTGAVIPRPVAWVSTVAPDGVPNLAPHSFFNVVSNVPPMVYFVTSSVGDAPDGVKDTLRNVRRKPEFVVSIASQRHLEAMVATASRVPLDIDEAAVAGVEMAPSTTVEPPRVADSPVAFECKVSMILQIGSGCMVFGEVQHVSLAADVLKEPINHLSELQAGGLDGKVIDPVARLGGREYATLSDIIEVPVPTWEELQAVQ